MRRIDRNSTLKRMNWKALGVMAVTASALSILAGCGAQAAETIYVSSSGSGENSGTDSANPVASIVQAQQLVDEGGTVILMDTCYVPATAVYDLSGFTVSMAEGVQGPVFEILRGGTLTLNNIVIDGPEGCLVHNSGELYIDDTVSFLSAGQELPAEEAIETAEDAAVYSGGEPIETAVLNLETDGATAAGEESTETQTAASEDGTEAQTAASEDGTEAQAADSGQSAGETEVEPVINETVTAIEEELNSLNVQSRSDSQALVTLYNRYNALTAAEKAGISQEAKDKLDEAVDKAGTYNHSDMNVIVTGDIPWYVQLQASSPEDAEQVTESGDLILSYDLTLWDLYTDSEYHLEEGQTVSVSVPLPNTDVSGSIRILHYKSDGTTEELETTQVGSRLYFETSSFSQFSLVTNTLVGVSPQTTGNTGTTQNAGSSQSTSGASIGTGTGTSGTAQSTGTASTVSTIPAQTADNTAVWPLAAAALLALGTAAKALRGQKNS